MSNLPSAEIRKHLLLIESATGDADVTLEEGFLDNLVTAAKSLFSIGSLGRYEMLSLYNPYEQQFRRAMGQKNQKYENVTWRTLMNFLISRVPLTLRFPKNLRPTTLTRQDVMEILNQRRLRDATFNQIRDALPETATADWLPNGRTIMSKLEDTISGDDTVENQKAFVGATVAKAYLMAAVMKLLEKAQGGEEFGTDQAEPAQAPTKQAPSEPASLGTSDAAKVLADLKSTLQATPGIDPKIIDAINQYQISKGIR